MLKQATFIVLLVVTTSIGGQGGAQQKVEVVDADTLFAEADEDLVYVEVPAGAVLRFDANKKALYRLRGRPMELIADVVEVVGKISIVSFESGEGKGLDVKPAVATAGEDKRKANSARPNRTGCGDYAIQGCAGETGGPGTDGRDGGDTSKGGADAIKEKGASAGGVVLRVREIRGSGTLTVNTSGGEGGRGQKGGRGGNGGDGGDGFNRTCETSCGNGGPAGRPGTGGAGGKGAPGGDAGPICYDERLGAVISDKKLTMISAGGPGGPGGEGGDEGKPGQPGQHGGGGCSYGGCEIKGLGFDAAAANYPAAFRGRSGAQGASGASVVPKLLSSCSLAAVTGR